MSMVDEACEQVKDLLQRLTRPGEMTREEALELYETVADYSSEWAATLREEIQRHDEAWA